MDVQYKSKLWFKNLYRMVPGDGVEPAVFATDGEGQCTSSRSLLQRRQTAKRTSAHFIYHFDGDRSKKLDCLNRINN